MTIRFAPAETSALVAAAAPLPSRRARALRRRCVARVANDNCPGAAVIEANNRALKAALQHFAEHGLNAGPIALSKASEALAAGDAKQHDAWKAIARTFDGGAAQGDVQTVMAEG